MKTLQTVVCIAVWMTVFGGAILCGTGLWLGRDLSQYDDCGTLECGA